VITKTKILKIKS